MGFELKTILLAMTPINELRGTIPLAIGLWQLSPLKAFFLAVFGNMIPVFFLLWFWKHLAKYLMGKSKNIERFFNWFFKRTRQRFYKNLPRSARKNLVTRSARNKKQRILVDIALVLLVAIPLPFTGAWTGTAAAFLFDIPYKKSLGLIFIGIVIAGLIVTLATLGFISII